MATSFATLVMTKSPDGATAPHEDTIDATVAPTPSTQLSETERAAALRAGRAPVPMKFIVRASLGLVAAVAFGTLMEHVFGNVGQPSKIVSATTTRAPRASATTNAYSSIVAMMGLHAIDSTTAPSISLTDQYSQPWQLRTQRGHVVVLTFFDQFCHDICPVLGAELREANEMLGANSHVTFAIVNTNPTSVAVNSHSAALQGTGLSQSANVFFLTGPLTRLNSVWKAYGVQILKDANGNLAHNNVLYFITPQGRLNSLAIPFGNENHLGVYSLSATEIHRFAIGIAHIATSLGHQ